jgi:hypothetical protein
LCTKTFPRSSILYAQKIEKLLIDNKMQYICFETKVEKDGEIRIWRGRNDRIYDNFIFLSTLAFYVLIILGCIFAFDSRSGPSYPSRYGVVNEVDCREINRNYWCIYKVGILETRRMCDIEFKGSAGYKVNDTIPLNVNDKWECSISECAEGCGGHRTEGYRMIWAAIAIVSFLIVVSVSCDIGTCLRIKYTNPDVIIAVPAEGAANSVEIEMNNEDKADDQQNNENK